MTDTALICSVLPRRLILELTRNCNLRCRMCVAHSAYRKIPVICGDLSNSVLKKISPLIRTLESLELGGLGEPLLAKNFASQVATFRRMNRKLKITLFTNGVLLKKKDIYDAVVANVDYMQISVNGVGKSYEENMVGAAWPVLIDVLARLKKEIRKPLIAMGYIVMRNNVWGIFRALFVAKRYAIQELALKDLWISFEDIRSESVRTSFFWWLTLGIICVARILAFFLQVRLTTVDFPLSKSSFSAVSDVPQCLAPWSQIQIQITGDVLLCCNGRTIIGNIKKQSLEKIWNSHKALNYRRGILEKNYYKQCRTCKILIGRTSPALTRQS